MKQGSNHPWLRRARFAHDESKARRIACPRCQAKAGEACVHETGYCTRTHVERLKAWREAEQAAKGAK